MITYERRDVMMTNLALQVAEELSLAIGARGRASLCVPGGTTPAPFMRALSMQDLGWSQVTVMLGDERFVPENSGRSNTRLLKENLLINKAQSASLAPLTKNANQPEDILEELTLGIAPHLPLDVLVVGMGEDMHTASLFPDTDLTHALSDDAPNLAIIRADNAGEARITMTAPVLKNARYKHILLAGKNKLAPLEKAKNIESFHEAPIRVVLTTGATIHYAE